jgi:hypothetical protein
MAGIGVGVAVLVIIIAILAALFFRVQRLQRRLKTSSTEAGAGSSSAPAYYEAVNSTDGPMTPPTTDVKGFMSPEITPSLQQHPALTPELKAEVDGSQQTYEMPDNRVQPGELDSRNLGPRELMG